MISNMVKIMYRRTFVTLCASAYGILAAWTPALWAAWPPQVPAIQAAQQQWKTEVFPISFWCGPPPEFVNEERYQQIKDAGFTYIMPNCAGGSTPEGNQKILDVAEKVGLKAFLLDPRMPRGVPDEASRQRIAEIVAAYHEHPAFAGYFIGDEPGAGAFAAIGETVAVLRELDPDHIAYLNLYPNYAPLHALGTTTYETYVQQFVEVVNPAVISYDHYHFLNESDRPGFMQNLETVRRVAQQSGLPFWQIVLSINHFDYRPLNEAEKRFEAMQTLAYGGKGVMFFTYWQVAADGHWGDAIINFDGTPTRQYEEVQRINRDVQAIGKYLLPATSVTAFEFGQPGDHTHTGDDIVRFEGPRITVGVFADGATRYAMFANRDYRSEVAAEVLVNTGGSPLEKLQKTDGSWIAVDAASQGQERKVPLKIAAGDGELYRWTVK